MGVPYGGNTLGTKYFDEEKLEQEEEEGGGRRERAFTSKFVYSLPLYVFLSFDGCNSFSKDFLVSFLRV